MTQHRQGVLKPLKTEQADQPGFSGMEMGQAFMPDGHLMGWTPGMAPNPGRDGLAWRLDPGTDFCVATPHASVRPTGNDYPNCRFSFC